MKSFGRTLTPAQKARTESIQNFLQNCAVPGVRTSGAEGSWPLSDVLARRFKAGGGGFVVLGRPERAAQQSTLLMMI